MILLKHKTPIKNSNTEITQCWVWLEGTVAVHGIHIISFTISHWHES